MHRGNNLWLSKNISITSYTDCIKTPLFNMKQPRGAGADFFQYTSSTSFINLWLAIPIRTTEATSYLACTERPSTRATNDQWYIFAWENHSLIILFISLTADSNVPHGQPSTSPMQHASLSWQQSAEQCHHYVLVQNNNNNHVVLLYYTTTNVCNSNILNAIVKRAEWCTIFLQSYE